MKNFVLKGWLAAGVSVAAAFGLVLSVILAINISSGALVVTPQGVTNYDTLQVGDGSVSEPAFGFTSDTDVGLYRVSANDIGVSVGGSKVGDFTSSGWTGGVSVGNNDLSGRNITATGTANVAGAAALDGGLTMDTSAFSVADTTGNTVVSGTLTVTSTSALVGAVTANSTITATGSITTQSSFFQDGVAFTGPLVGSTGSVVDGGTIAHGVGTTPTMAVCGIVNAGVLTETVYISATDATNITLGIFDAAGAAWTEALTVHCLATR